MCILGKPTEQRCIWRGQAIRSRGIRSFGSPCRRAGWFEGALAGAIDWITAERDSCIRSDTAGMLRLIAGGVHWAELGRTAITGYIGRDLWYLRLGL